MRLEVEAGVLSVSENRTAYMRTLLKTTDLCPLCSQYPSVSVVVAVFIYLNASEFCYFMDLQLLGVSIIPSPTHV